MKRMLITGASSGIGKAVAELAFKKGYTVTACGRNQQALDQLPSGIQSLVFDVTDKQDCEQALSTQQPDIILLNAGVCEYVDIENFDAAMIERVFAANFFGVVNCLAALLPNLNAGSQIAIVDSLARMLPFSRAQAYGASKAAVYYFAQSLRVDLANKGILVQTVSPGFVETPMTDRNRFAMPMKISVDQAATALIKGLEQKQASIYFPTLFSLILRSLSRLPSSVKVALSKQLNRPKDTQL